MNGGSHGGHRLVPHVWSLASSSPPPTHPQVTKMAKGEVLMLNIGSMCTGACVIAVKHDLAKLQLTSPVCTKVRGDSGSGRGTAHWALTLQGRPKPHQSGTAPTGIQRDIRRGSGAVLTLQRHPKPHQRCPSTPRFCLTLSPLATLPPPTGGREGGAESARGEALAAHRVGADTEGAQDGAGATELRGAVGEGRDWGAAQRLMQAVTCQRTPICPTAYY